MKLLYHGQNPRDNLKYPLVINYPYVLVTFFFFLYSKEELIFKYPNKIPKSALQSVYSRNENMFVQDMTARECIQWLYSSSSQTGSNPYAYQLMNG